MKKQNTQKVFCYHCGKHALAHLNAVPYCTGCLLHQIDVSGQRRMKQYIVPLFGPDESETWHDRWPEADGAAEISVPM